MTSLERLVEADAVARLARRDASLLAADPAGEAAVAPWMGWVGLAQAAPPVVEQARDIAERLSGAGFTDAVLLGMGGSSLASIVLGWVIGPAPDAMRLHVLDTTSPETVLSVADKVPPATTVVLVASKSGGTIEPMSLYAIFRERFDAALGREEGGKRFIALTDADSDLERLAVEQGFWTTLTTPSDVGGRYSALTAFHLLPAALMGLDLDELVSRAQAMEAACATPGPANPALELASFMGDAVEAGRDKLVLVTSDRIAPFSLWVEQLVAESLGKLGRGVIPVPVDGPGALMGADPDRAIVVVRFEDDDLTGRTALKAPDAPIHEIVLSDSMDLAGQFVLWEYATALAGFLLGVNPFDQPNVAEAKAATAAILAQPSTGRTEHYIGDHQVLASGLPPETPQSIEMLMLALTASLAPGSYLAVLAYVPEAPDFTRPLRTAVDALAWATGKATMLELGPRYLHSTGQLHKGGPAKGAFLIVMDGRGHDVAIPGAGYSLRELMHAQALGDFGALSEHGLPVVFVDVTSAGEYGVDNLGAILGRVAQKELEWRRQASESISTSSTDPADTSTTATE